MAYKTEKIEFKSRLEQELSFDYCTEIFAKCKVEFSKEKFDILGIIKPAGRLFTNLGWLLSDQCSHSVKVAVFGDEHNTVFRDRKEFTGSILRQLEEACDYPNLLQARIKIASVDIKILMILYFKALYTPNRYNVVIFA